MYASRLLDGRMGSTVYHKETDTMHTTKVQGEQTVIRAELAATVAAVFMAPPTTPCASI